MARRRVCGERVCRSVGGSTEDLLYVLVIFDSCIQAASWQVTIPVQWYRNFPMHLPRFRRRYLYQSIRTCGNQVLAIVAEAKTTTAALVPTGTPCCLNAAATDSGRRSGIGGR